MKKLFTFLFVALILNGCGINQNRTNDLKEDNLRGNIKSIRQYYYNVNVSHGEITKGDLLSLYVADYNDKGNIKKSYENSETSCNSKTTYKYNYRENLIKIVVLCDGEIYSITKYKYDWRGNRDKKTEYDKNGKIKRITKYKYDKNHFLIEKDVDEEGDLFKVKYQNNKYGKMTESRVIFGPHTSKINFFKYNSTGKLIEELNYNKNGKLIRKIVNIYDFYDNIIEAKITFPDFKRTLKNKYEYDKFGNWISDLSFTNGRPTNLVERKIDYFE